MSPPDDNRSRPCSRRTLFRAALVGAALAFAARSPAQAMGSALTVFAAASLADALGAIAAAEPEAPRLVLAASSTLARQIEAGAPADIFISANLRWMDRLERTGLLVPGTRTDIASNRLVLVAAQGIALAPGALPELFMGTTGRIAMGDPDHVPAGLYGRAAIEHLGLWQTLAPRLARTDNTRAALALVARGEAPIGIVYATDARAVPDLRVLAEFPPESHPPIRYPAAIVAGRESAQARAFLERLSGPEGRRIFASHGFGAP